MLVGQSALVDQLKNYADILNAQYEVTYMRPAGSRRERIPHHPVQVDAKGTSILRTVAARKE